MAHKSKWKIDEAGRECSRCGVYKTWDHFGNNKHGTRERQSWCRKCFRQHCGRTEKKEYLITEKGRECSICGTFKPWSDFHRRRDISTGRMSACKVCIKRKSRNDKEQGRIRNAELKRKYNIGLNEYLEMFNEQDGKCLICGANESTVRGESTTLSLSVDHNHDTGKIRGLLCQKCNSLIGMAKDDVGILARAIRYLEGELA